MLFCPVSGLKVTTNREWCGKKIAGKLSPSYRLVGSSIIYSLPKGAADLKSTTESLSLNARIVQTALPPGKKYIQIEDYAYISSTTLSARKQFIKTINSNEQCIAVIFCNLSPMMDLALKIGRRFKTSKVEVHVAAQYRDAIRTAQEICKKNNMIQEKADLDFGKKFPLSSKVLKPVNIISDGTWLVEGEGFYNRSVLLDSCILHSVTSGRMEPCHIPLVDSLRDDCQAALPKNHTIEYIMVDCRHMKGANRAARKEYMQSLKRWHEKFPIKLYIAYNANLFMRTALKLAGPLMPFKVRSVKNFSAAWQVIEDDRLQHSGKPQPSEKKKKAIRLTENDMDRLLEQIGGLDMTATGTSDKIPVGEEHPLFYIYQSINLVKEEIDDLFRERKQREKILKEGQGRYRSLFKNNHAIMMILEPGSGRIVDANPAALKFYGWSHEEITRKFISEINTLTPGEIQQAMVDAKKEQRNHFFFKHRIADGRIRDVEIYSGPICINGESLLYSIIHDITDRRSAEKKLKASRNNFRLFIDTSPDFYFLKDIEGHYLMINKSNAEYFGKAEPEIVGKTDFELMSEEIAGHFHHSDRRVLEEKKTVITNESIGDDVFEIRKVPVFENSHITGIAGFIRNITAQKKIEIERENLISQLQGALEEIKTLQGIVPICSTCKKIRDDQGYWNELESYIQKHSHASFSHGMCPDCSDKFYGDEAWYQRMKEKKEDS